MFPLANTLGPLGPSAPRAAVGGSFSPTDIPGLLIWLRADSLTGTLADGDLVETWPDGSGNGNDAVQHQLGNRPAFRTGQLNGLPAMTFDGAHPDRFDLASGGLVSIPFTCFVVGKTTSTFPTQEFVIVADELILCGYQGAGNWAIGHGTAFVSSGSSTLNTWRTCEYVRSSASDLELVTDGGTPVVASDATAIGSGITLNAIGNDQFGQPLDGSIAEIVIYGSVLSGPDRARVRAGLRSIYAHY